MSFIRNLIDAAVGQLKLLQQPGDTETTHLEADKILCQVLIELGYQELVDEYRKVPKWYA